MAKIKLFIEADERDLFLDSFDSRKELNEYLPYYMEGKEKTFEIADYGNQVFLNKK